MPSRRHCRQTGPMYLAKFFSLPLELSGFGYQLSAFGAVYSRWLAFVPLLGP